MNQYDKIRQSIAGKLTLRLRLALWVGGLMAVSIIVLLLFVNITTTVSTSSNKVVTVTVPEDLLLPGWEVSGGLVSNLNSGELTDEVSNEKPAASTGNKQTSVSMAVPASEVEDIQRGVFHQMRVFSLIGLGLMVLIVVAGSYWMAGRALRPVRELARTAEEIDADKLKTHLNTRAPDGEVRQLSVSLDNMLHRLDAAFEQQGRFVADAAHELRTPLATIRTSLEVIGMDNDATPEDYLDIGLNLETAIVRLQQLVDDLLLMATGQHVVPETPVILEPLLEEAVAELEPLARERSVGFNLDCGKGGEGLITRGDGVLLMRVFQNLIQNAIRCNKQGGQVTIRTSQDNGWAVIAIADTGIGIPSEHLPNIFKRFYRVDGSGSQHSGGFGLGLSIAEHIVHLHGGRIEVESTPGVGSTFTVRLPTE